MTSTNGTKKMTLMTTVLFYLKKQYLQAYIVVRTVSMSSSFTLLKASTYYGLHLG